ncbi:MAG: hypothetical protein FJ404_12270 [Verrucomicrobia bacterium]|nr:hypothetical protein [Verrucomicrobiota bacterium]
MSSPFPENPDAERPARLSLPARVVVVLLISAAFFSGVAIWAGQFVQQRDLATPFWLRPAVLVHGALNPVLCALFGWLVCQHMRAGWHFRINVPTGVVMEVVFAGLVVSGAVLQYWGSEHRDTVVWAHRVLGLMLPVGLGIHWAVGLKWAKSIR